MKTLLLCLLTASVSAQTYQRWIIDPSLTQTNRVLSSGEVVSIESRSTFGDWHGIGGTGIGKTPVLTAFYPDTKTVEPLSIGDLIVGPATISAVSSPPMYWEYGQTPTGIIVLKTVVASGVAAQVPFGGNPAIVTLESSNDLITWTTQASVTVSNPPPSLYFRARIR